jgi:hypothetical protein
LAACNTHTRMACPHSSLAAGSPSTVAIDGILSHDDLAGQG